MNVRIMMLCLAVIVVLFALFAGASVHREQDADPAFMEESALIHGNLVHDEPILLGSDAEQIIIQP